MIAQLAAWSCDDFEVMGSNPTIRWATFGLNPHTRSSRISRISSKMGPDQPVVYTKKKYYFLEVLHTWPLIIYQASQLIETLQCSKIFTFEAINKAKIQFPINNGENK